MQPGRRTWCLRATAAAAWALAAPLHAADLPQLVAASKPSVLPVGTFSPTDSPRFGFRGSGFVVGNGNLVITNFHVLPAAADPAAALRLVVMVGRSEGNLRNAQVVATDRTRDLALLQIDGPPLPVLALAEPGTAREGQTVLLLGYPIGGVLGFATVAHRGIVSSITSAALPANSASQLDPRAIAQLRAGSFEMLQLDATAYPGSSGGPLLDAESGRVIGVVSMGLVKGVRESALSNPTGITYAVPVQFVHELLKQPR
jgi:serine protease Do